MFYLSQIRATCTSTCRVSAVFPKIVIFQYFD